MIEMANLEFDDQVATLTRRAPVEDRETFRATLERARPDGPQERSVLTVGRDVVPLAELATRVERDGHEIAFGHLEPDELASFLPIDAVEVPATPAYLAVDVDLGAATRNVRPEDALERILTAGRSPLTIDEGISLMLQHPDAIAKSWGFSMAGSRRGDQRVPAFWVSEGRPKLGWCWDRNPHTWLGTASCAERIVGS